MKHLTWALLFVGTMAHGQNTFTAKIIDQETGEPLIGATAQISPELGAVANTNGILIIKNIPNGTFKITFSFVGYEEFRRAFTFPDNSNNTVIIELKPGEELEEVIITATRSGRTIDEIPTRVEAIGAEELEEKAVMRSANIAMLLRESTGIQMQQTSASSANQSIRIQGLDGRYTQMLKDGFPLYSGFSGGLSIMQIPPLDLRQVEVIKGSNSTLYGGGAIAGLVNLVTFVPEQTRRLRLMLDQTGAGGTTFNGFYAKRKNKTGLTFYTSANRQEAYDANEDHFSDIPRIRSLTLNPSLFYYFNPKSQLRLTLNTTLEDRLGGDMQVIKEETQNGIHQFTQENETKRLSYQLSYKNEWDNHRILNIKNSLTYFQREIREPEYVFDGKQWSSFSEISYSFGHEASHWIGGGNLYSDKFDESPFDSLSRDYEHFTMGAFLQNTFSISEKLTLESGFRIDHNTDYGFFPLPKVSLLAKINDSWSSRIGGGLGYKIPTIFTGDAENLTFQGILPINTGTMEAERSVGGNFDVNYKGLLSKEWTLSINQLFFYTRLNDALVLRENNTGQFFYENANGQVESKGIETNIQLGYKDFKLFTNYALIDTRLKYDNLNKQKPLTPKHNIGAVLMYEEEGKWRIGYEAYYTGRQYRNNDSPTKSYWIMGLMAMRKFDKLSLYLNFENFTDTRQHRMENFAVSEHFKPEFPELWGPTDGRIINAGLIFEF